MSGFIWTMLGVLSGAAIAIQAPLNAALARGLGLPVAAAAISFISGAILLAIVSIVAARWQGIAIDFRAPSPWLFVIGGALGAFYVTCAVILAPRIGAAALMALVIAGQLLAGMLADRIGMMGLAVREIGMGRMAGAMLLVTGALLIRFY